MDSANKHRSDGHLSEEKLAEDNTHEQQIQQLREAWQQLLHAVSEAIAPVVQFIDRISKHMRKEGKRDD